MIWNLRAIDAAKQRTGNCTMKKKIIFAVLVGVSFCAIMEAVEMVRSGKWSGSLIYSRFQFAAAVVSMALFVIPLVFLVYSFVRTKPTKSEIELGDDDGGIDWREKNAVGEMVQIWNGWAVLLNDAPVHDAKALADKLESSQIRCRLELLKEDRAFHLYGNGGMGTRMCVLVAPSDYAAAKKELMEHNGRHEP